MRDFWLKFDLFQVVFLTNHQSDPVFQVNCLRDSEGEIIEGATRRSHHLETNSSIYIYMNIDRYPNMVYMLYMDVCIKKNIYLIFFVLFWLSSPKCGPNKQHGSHFFEAVDDIRTVCYAMAVTRHPQLDKLDLEYPWQVSELAILWNQSGAR